MLRLAGVVIPEHKHLVIGLTAIKGIGGAKASNMLAQLKIAEDAKPADLNEKQEQQIRELIEKELIEGDLTRQTSMDIKRLQDIGTWRGNRHRNKLPTRGQTTRRNARTRRGKKKTGGSGRVKLTKT
jgi:small subunit ribosomal protein S13